MGRPLWRRRRGRQHDRLGTGSTSPWQVISRDVERDIQSVFSTFTVSAIQQVQISRNDLRVDDIRLSDARTTRVYTLLPSALGGIVSIRQVNPTGPNTDTWYGYDRLGNVMLTVGATGTCVNLPGELWRLQDAYGNELADWTTGQWATVANAEGYGLTTKWYDGDVELNYFWQRWYGPGIGVFASAAPPPIEIEHPYGYATSNPGARVDPQGLYLVIPSTAIPENPNWGLIDILGGPGSCTPLAIIRWSNDLNDFIDDTFGGPGSHDRRNQLRHCIWQCLLRHYCGEFISFEAGDFHEIINGGRMTDHLADAYNNGRGRHHGERVHCPGDCITRCKKDYRNGLLADESDAPSM